METITLEQYVEYGLKALKERKEALISEFSKTTNPLDRLSLRDKIEELDLTINYFSKYNELNKEGK